MRIVNCIIVFQYKELPDITGIPTSAKWTREEFDEGVKSDPPEKFGLRHDCIFNCLRSFHCIGGQMPHDPMHDFHEKTAPCDGAGILMALINAGKFTAEEYNRQLSDLSLSGYESSDRPSVVKYPCKRLPGKALSIALHIRLMPYVLWRMGLATWMQEDEDMKDLFSLLINLHRQNEFIQAETISVTDPEHYEELRVSYLETRKRCQEKFGTFSKLTPKDHFQVYFLSHTSLQFNFVKMLK